MSLLDWINEHDCGVSPTAVQREDGAIEVRVLCVGPDGESVQTDVVRTYAEARDVLGY
jgi:hypothetical protein